MDKWQGVYTDDGKLFKLKREGNSDTGYNVDERGRYHAKGTKLDTKVQITYSTYVKHLDYTNSQRKSRMVAARVRGIGSYCLMGAGFQSEKMESSRDGRW